MELWSRDALMCPVEIILFYCLLWFHFSESAKGSDSEDDFIRQKTKAKAASDSDSDSDIGTKKSKKLSEQINIFTANVAVLFHRSIHISNHYRSTAKKTAADDLFGEADDISSDSDAEKPLTPGQPLVCVCVSSCSDHQASLIVQSPFYKSSQISFSQSLSLSLSELIPIIMGRWIIQMIFFFFKCSLCVCVQDAEDGIEGEQAEEEPAPETRIEVEIPKVSTDLGSDLYFVKLPNFLSVEPRSEHWHSQ